jgi:sigma-B regulation protein RsbU (phosphoserine phosphatase)
MRVPPKAKKVLARLGWVERIFAVLALVYVLLLIVRPLSGWTALAEFAMLGCGFVIAVRLLRIAAKRAIWRLRNRLIVTYLFIAVVPVILVITLAGLALYGLTIQVAVYLVTSELDRRIGSLQTISNGVTQAEPSARPEVMRRMAELIYKERFPDLEMVLNTRGVFQHYPSDSTLEPPPAAWDSISGVVMKDGRYYGWSHARLPDGGFTVVVPLSREYLANLVPNLGVVQFRLLRQASGRTSFKLGNRSVEVQSEGGSDVTESLPPPANQFDIEVRWSALVPVENWQSPGAESNTLLLVRSRPSAVYGALFSRKSDTIQGFIPIALVAISILFLIVELFALVIGISMTRTITAAVHCLYLGTRKVMHGDFSHRIEVQGNDQLAELSHSFNQMTARIEELLVVSKEKERLQSELEIAREVQNQLYPKKVPEVRTLRLTAVCKPARMVSGDYFDYECIADSKVALAIGDVAGKGISAALLMATLQSALRTELRGSFEIATVAGNGRSRVSTLSTAELVGHLNEQLFNYTSPEKYATFYLGIYDEAEGVLSYTNAGHLPPILLRNGDATRLNVDGTVVGAFPFAQYDESRVKLEPGDLLVCFTDGVSEPENEYGEMFGEDRLIELVRKNAHRSEDQIIATLIEAVEQWTGSPELQDDMTLLLARRC